MSVLDQIIVGVREDLAGREAARPLADVRAALADVDPARDPMPHFRAPGSSVIAEVKRKSPSKGELADIPDPAALATAYAAGRCRGDLGAHRASAASAGRSTTSSPSARRSTPRCCARTSS